MLLRLVLIGLLHVTKRKWTTINILWLNLPVSLSPPCILELSNLWELLESNVFFWECFCCVFPSHPCKCWWVLLLEQYPSCYPWVPLQEVPSLLHLQLTRVHSLETQPEILVQAPSLPRVVLSGSIELLKSSSSL